ncbi:MAG TPA: enoyl-CoA hydratase/isomerase family protein [Dehalococcoidia bacterium]|nr:enoyl-CoA hydratase/isomerase family protein [Dehalococcoidia bacterium]
MSYCLYEVDKEKRIATLTFNRPEKLHALVPMDDLEEVISRLYEADRDDNVAVVVMKGSGRAFGAGYDIDAVRSRRGFSEDKRPPQRRRYWGVDEWWGRRGILQKILTCDKVTIAQVHGYCYGGHFEMMCACDLAIASEDALFTHPGYTYLGIEGPIPLYVLMIGWRRVKEMMLLGDPLTASKAHEFGLVNRVVPLSKLEEEVAEIAEKIAGRPLDGIVMGKKEFQLAMDIMGLSAGYDLASISHTLMSNLKFGPGEFNLMREMKDKGRTGMYSARDKRYGDQAWRAEGAEKKKKK